MKSDINDAIFKHNKLRFGEIFLFREMANSLNNITPTIFVQETHGRRGWVQFHSEITNSVRQKEISDLLIVCLNKPTNEIKISFLQAKYHRTTINPFLRFYGDYLQLELLKKRPVIHQNNFLGFPENILSFSNFRSLTSYGVFYHDTGSSIDMLYSVSDLLNQENLNRLVGSIIFPGNQECPKMNCFTANRKEMISTCNLDLFERGILSFQIGAPINSNTMIEAYFKKLFKYIISNANGLNSSILSDLLGDFVKNTEDTENEIKGNPSMLIIQTNSEQIKE